MKKQVLILWLIGLCFMPTKAYAYLDALDGLLSSYVAQAKEEKITYNGVDYDAWSQDRRSKDVLKKIQKMDLKNLKTDSEKLSFWINAYNFFIIDLIIQKGERDSIQDLRGAEGVWDRYKWSIDGDVYTLNDIVEKIKEFKEPKAFFALSCASKSCVDVRKEAYQPKKLTQQLNDQVRLTLQNETKGFKGPKAGQNIAIVNDLFKTYEDQFNRGKIKSWLQPYFPNAINVGTKIEYFKHNWALNSAKK